MNEYYDLPVPAQSEPGFYPVWQTVHQLEQATAVHARLQGYDQDTMLARYNAVWMIVRAWLQFSEPPRTELPLTVRTSSRGLRRATTLRDFDLIQDGRCIGEAVQAWVMVDAEARRLLDMSRMPEITGAASPAQCKTVRPRKPAAPQPLTEYPPLLPTRQDVDRNGHVNNAAYLRLALQNLPKPVSVVRELEISYSHECFAGAPIGFFAWQQAEQCFVHCLTPEGAPAFDLAARE